MHGLHFIPLAGMIIAGLLLAVAGWESLATERIVAIGEELLQEDDRDGGRIFDTWVPAVEASDDEVMARVTGDVIAADIVELDQKARIIQAEPIRLEKTTIPKLKHGIGLTESMQDLLMRIGSNLATTRDRVMFDNWIARNLRRLLNGIRDRRELFLGAMLRDDWDYNRNGIIASNVSWGMPSALKITASPAWSDAANATPIADIEEVLQAGEDNYGEAYDTIVMTRATWAEMAATTEFKNRAQSYFQLNFVSGTFPAGSRMDQTMLAEQILTRRGSDGQPRPMKILIYNKRTKEEAGAGTLSTVQFVNDGDVLFVDSRDFGDTEAWDFANATVIETLPGNVPLLIGNFPDGPTSGPIGYATGADPHGNPPGQLLWACQRGFPRKHRLSASALLVT